MKPEVTSYRLEIAALISKLQLANFEISYLKSDVESYERRSVLKQDRLNDFERKEAKQLHDYERRISEVKSQMNYEIEI